MIHKRKIQNNRLKPGFVYSDKYHINIGDHVFPTIKYGMTREKLVKDKYIKSTDIKEPKIASDKDILLVHTHDYLDDLKNLRWTPRTMFSELPLSPEIIYAYLLAAGGTTLAGRLALIRGIGIHIGGGFHHGFADHAEGFCYINDIAVCIRVLQEERKIKKAFVVDCDLHQGNGTAHIFQNDPSVFTFSIHQEHNYPIKRKSDIDIGLENFIGDREYLKELKKVIPKEIDLFEPDMVVYVAGADPYEEDQLGALKLTKGGLKQRDEWIIEACIQRKLPLVIVFAGGYAKNTQDTIDIHSNTCICAIKSLDRGKRK